MVEERARSSDLKWAAAYGGDQLPIEVILLQPLRRPSAARGGLDVKVRRDTKDNWWKNEKEGRREVEELKP